MRASPEGGVAFGKFVRPRSAAGQNRSEGDLLGPSSYGRQMPVSTRGEPFGSWTGRAVSARRGGTVPDGPPGPTFLIVGPGCWQPASRAITRAGARFKVVILAESADVYRHNLIDTGILAACLSPQTVAELQSMVNCDAGILLTVDICRQDVRARGRLVGRFEMPPFWCGEPADPVASRLLMAQRLLGSADLAGDERIRLQRRFTAICDAMKAPGADPGRSARRLDRLLADLAARSQTRLS